jgi:hypothetical protein
VAQAHQRMTGQRVQNDPAKPLPSFEMPWIEAVDPDRTLKWRPLRADGRVAPSANSTEEISADDVLEVIKVGRMMPGEATPEVVSADVASVAALRSRVCPNPRITVVPEPSPRLPPRPPEDRADPLRFTEPERGSVAPVALDDNPFLRSRAASTFSLDDTPYGFRMPRMGVAIAAGLGAMIGIFVLVFALGSAGAKPVVRSGERPAAAAPTPVAPAPQVKAASEGARSSVQTIDVTSLPQAHVGSVSLSMAVTGHRLFVDGAVVSNGSAVVSCGKHLVKVGSKGRKQEVDVPCGTDVAVGY